MLKNIYVFNLSVYLSSCLYMSLVNILQMPWNLYMLFISDIAWTALKMIYIRLMVCLQRHAKFSKTLRPMWRKCLKRILRYLGCTKDNEINISHLHKKSIFRIKIDWKSTNIMCTGPHKIFPMHFTGKNFLSAF